MAAGGEMHMLTRTLPAFSHCSAAVRSNTLPWYVVHHPPKSNESKSFDLIISRRWVCCLSHVLAAQTSTAVYLESWYNARSAAAVVTSCSNRASDS